MNYSEKLKDPRWQRKRLQILERDNFQCQVCGDIESSLHVHHITYYSNKLPWEYEDILLISLCDECHDSVHHLKSKIKLIIDLKFIHFDWLDELHSILLMLQDKNPSQLSEIKHYLKGTEAKNE